MTELEKEFITWVIVRNSMTVMAMLLASAVSMWWARKLKKAKSEHWAVFIIFAIFFGFIVQQNVHGIIKAAATPKIYLRTYWSLDPIGEQELRKSLKAEPTP